MTALLLVLLFALLLFVAWFGRGYYTRKVARIKAFSKTHFEYVLRSTAGKQEWCDIPPETMAKLARELASKQGWDWTEEDFRRALEAQFSEVLTKTERINSASVRPTKTQHDELTETRLEPLAILKQKFGPLSVEPDDPQQWIGGKCSWIAYRADHSHRLLQFLDPVTSQEANWSDAMKVTGEDAGWTFVPPSINGWVLVRKLSGVNYEQPVVFERWRAEMCLASEQFGEVQYFASFRVSESFQYARFSNGNLVRWVAVDDGCVRSEHGEPTAEELSLGYTLWRRAIAEESEHLSAEECEARSGWSADKLPFDLANLWSVDPTRLAIFKLPKSTVHLILDR